MRFLKSSVYHAIDYDQQSTVSAWENRINAYEKYLKKNENKFDKRLYKLFTQQNWFHDFEIHEISYQALAVETKNKRDLIKFVISFDNASYILFFENVQTVKLNIDINTDEEFYFNRGIDDIILSELYLKNDTHVLDFLTASGSELSFQFKKVKIQKMILKRPYFLK